MDMWIPASFYRGGTSKGVFFHARDLPADRAAREKIFLAVLGSPDANNRQLDGLGGGVSSLSKAVVVSPSAREDADVDYLFAQVAVDRPVMEWGANCGNLSSAVGPFALSEGLVRAQGADASVRIFQVNTAKIIHARFPVENGQPSTRGDLVIDGVSGTGAPIALDFIEPAGSLTAGLLPTGRPCDRLSLGGERSVRVSLVDATNPVVFARACDFGLSGTETPDEIEARPSVMAMLDRARRSAAVLMGLAESAQGASLANPKIALLCEPAPYQALDGRQINAESFEIGVRMVSMERVHRAVTLTAGMCLAAACGIEGTLAHELARQTGEGPVRIGHPSGVLPAGAGVSRRADSTWHVDRATTFRTARCLMKGSVHIPAGRLADV